MKIVAFLQSPSKNVFPEETPKHVLDRYRDDQLFHRKMLRQSMTGGRLYQSFGPMFDEIWWDNVAPEGKEANIKHVTDVIVKHEPDLILTFGVTATEAVGDSVASIRIKVMECHHPNARYKTQSDLDDFASKVREHIWTHQAESEDNES